MYGLFSSLLHHCCRCHGRFCVFSNIPSLYMARLVSDRVDLILELIVYSSVTIRLSIRRSKYLESERDSCGQVYKVCAGTVAYLGLCVHSVQQVRLGRVESEKGAATNPGTLRQRKENLNTRTCSPRPRTLFGCYGDANIQMHTQRRRIRNVAEL